MTDVKTPAEWLVEQFDCGGRDNGWVMRDFMELVDDASEDAIEGMRWFPPGENRKEWYASLHPDPVDSLLAWWPDAPLPEPASDFTFGPEYVKAPVTAS